MALKKPACQDLKINGQKYYWIVEAESLADTCKMMSQRIIQLQNKASEDHCIPAVPTEAWGREIHNLERLVDVDFD